MARPATVVIGAGVVGCQIARELTARDPEVSITVLDRDAAAAWANRRPAGLSLLRGRPTDPAHVRLRRLRPGPEPVPRALDRAGRTVFAGAANASGGRLAPAMASEAVDLLHLHRSEGVASDHQHV
jgi:glycine/D-amino acid oxidase-like deaminating enzyme